MKVDKAANFVFAQITEQDDKRHPDSARRDKVYLARERISSEMKESGFWLNYFETSQTPKFKLSCKNGCTQCFTFLILLLSLLLH
jgi:hypothetical protein